MNKAPEFKDFWKAYPRKRGKEDAEKAWKRLTAREKQKALAALPAYIADYQQNNISFKYPQGWLNGKRWKDYEEEDSETTTTATEKELPRKAGGGQADLFSQAERNPGEGQQSPTADPAAPLEGMETW